MASVPPLGSVEVEVSAPLDKLVRDFAAGKREAEKFDKAVGGGVKKSTDAAKRSTDQLGSSIDRTGDAARRSTADFDRYRNSLKATTEREIALIRSQRDMVRQAGVLGGMIGGLVAIIGTEAVSALTRMTSNAVKNAAALKGLAQQLGVTTADLQVYQYAGRQVGVTNEELERGLQQLTKTLGEAATGSVRDTKALRLVGFTLAEIKSGALTAGEALPRIADFLAKIPNPAQRAAVELAIFGETGQKLDPLLRQGSKGIDNLREAAERLGIVLSDDQIQRADETAAKLEDVKRVLEANIAGVVAENADAIVSLAQALGEVAGAVVDFMATNPEAAFAILGGIAGLAIGGRLGPAGAALGTGAGIAGGIIAGRSVRQSREDANMDLGFRTEQVRIARDELRARKEANADSGSLIRIRRSKSTQGGGDVASAEANLTKQMGLLTQAMQANTAARATGPVDPKLQAQLADLNAPRTRQRRGRRTTDRTAQREHAFQQALERSEDEYLQLQMEMTTDLDRLAELQRERLKAEQDAKLEDIAYREKRGELTETQANQLRLELERNMSLERELLDRDIAEQKARQQREITESSLRNEADLVEAQAGLARTAKDRGKFAVRLVEIQFELQRLGLQEIIASQTATDAQKNIARERLRILGDLQGMAVQSAKQSNLGPLASYFNEMPQSLDEVAEQMEKVWVDRLRDLDDRTQAFADNFASAMGRAAGSIAQFESPLKVLQSLVQDLANLFTQTFIEQPVTDWFKRRVSGGVAEQLVGGKAGQYGLDAAQMQAAFEAGRSGALNLGAAAEMAAVQLRGLAAGGIDPLGSAAGQTAQQFQSVTPEIDQFGSGLLAVLTSLSSGGSGGFAGVALGIAQMLAPSIGGGGAGGLFGGGIAGPSGNAYGVTSMGDIGIYDDGGWITPSRRTKSRIGTTNVRTWHEVGEFTVNKRSARRFGPLLEMINADRLPQFGQSAISQRAERLAPVMGPFQFGDINMTPTGDERYDRMTLRQARRAIADGVSDAIKAGYR